MYLPWSWWWGCRPHPISVSNGSESLGMDSLVVWHIVWHIWLSIPKHRRCDECYSPMGYKSKERKRLNQHLLWNHLAYVDMEPFGICGMQDATGLSRKLGPLLPKLLIWWKLMYFYGLNIGGIIELLLVNNRNVQLNHIKPNWEQDWSEIGIIIPSRSESSLTAQTSPKSGISHKHRNYVKGLRSRWVFLHNCVLRSFLANHLHPISLGWKWVD